MRQDATNINQSNKFTVEGEERSWLSVAGCTYGVQARMRHPPYSEVVTACLGKKSFALDGKLAIKLLMCSNPDPKLIVTGAKSHGPIIARYTN